MLKVESNEGILKDTKCILQLVQSSEVERCGGVV